LPLSCAYVGFVVLTNVRRVQLQSCLRVIGCGMPCDTLSAQSAAEQRWSVSNP
jgi:hypothetical protein